MIVSSSFFEKRKKLSILFLSLFFSPGLEIVKKVSHKPPQKENWLLMAFYTQATPVERSPWICIGVCRVQRQIKIRHTHTTTRMNVEHSTRKTVGVQTSLFLVLLKNHHESHWETEMVSVTRENMEETGVLVLGCYFLPFDWGSCCSVISSR